MAGAEPLWQRHALVLSDPHREIHAHLPDAFAANRWRKWCSIALYLSLAHHPNRFPRLRRKMFPLHPIFILFFMPLAGLATPINRPATLYRVISPFPCQDSSPITYRCWRQYGYHLTFRLIRLHNCCQKLEHEPFPTDRHPRLHHSIRQPSH